LINIVPADEHHLIRQGLRLLFEKHADFCIVGEAEDGLAAAQLVESIKNWMF
jgi:DNA-binding NarL/FixJ family response regulator